MLHASRLSGDGSISSSAMTCTGSGTVLLAASLRVFFALLVLLPMWNLLGLCGGTAPPRPQGGAVPPAAGPTSSRAHPDDVPPTLLASAAHPPSRARPSTRPDRRGGTQRMQPPTLLAGGPTRRSSADARARGHHPHRPSRRRSFRHIASGVRSLRRA